jgi:hypothetical protein
VRDFGFCVGVDPASVGGSEDGEPCLRGEERCASSVPRRWSPLANAAVRALSLISSRSVSLGGGRDHHLAPTLHCAWGDCLPVDAGDGGDVLAVQRLPVRACANVLCPNAERPVTML